MFKYDIFNEVLFKHVSTNTSYQPHSLLHLIGQLCFVFNDEFHDLLAHTQMPN